MKITVIPGGMMETNCYLITEEQEGISALVDPGFISRPLEDAVKAAGKVSAILLTHGHFDHISGVKHFQEMTGAKIYISSEDAAFLSDASLNLSGMLSPAPLGPVAADVELKDGDEIKLGGAAFRVLLTPGHTRGGCCYLAPGAIFTGDTLMCGSVGRTDFPTGSFPELLTSLKKLASLQGDYTIYPGHGPTTTLAAERRGNPYMDKEFAI